MILIFYLGVVLVLTFKMLLGVKITLLSVVSK